MAQVPGLPHGFELPLEPRLPRIGSVDQVAVEERAVSLSRRSNKRESKLCFLLLMLARDVLRQAKVPLGVVNIGTGDGTTGAGHAAEFLELKTVWHPIGV